MFRVKQSLETSKLLDDMFTSLSEFFTPTPEFGLVSVPVETSCSTGRPLSEASQRRRRRRRRAYGM